MKYLVSGKSGDHLPVSKADGTPDHRLMGAAWAALHGGYRGKEYAGPDKEQAIAKLTAMYKKEKMDTPSESFAKAGTGLSTMSEADVVAKMGDSFSAIRDAIDTAINRNIADGVDMDCDDDGAEDAAQMKYAWVRDVFPDFVCYSMEGQTFMCAWHRNADGSIFLGEPFPVDNAYVTVDNPFPQDEATESCRLAIRESGSPNAYDHTKGVLTVRVIQPGFNKSKERYYPADMLKRDYKIFEGAKMFANHASESEEKQRPEGSVHDWVANLTKVWAQENGEIFGEAVVIDPPFKAKLAALAEKNMLTDMGVSIRAIGEATTQEVDGHETRYVESLIAARSVDFVTYAGAGGAVMAIESGSLADENDVDLMTEAIFRQRRPDIVSIIEKQTKETLMKTLEQQLKEANEQLKTANEKIAATEKTARQVTAAAELAKLLTESKLPEVAVNRLKAQFKEAEKTEGMAEAITAEVDYIKSLTPVTKNNGASDNGTASEAGKDVKANLTEAYKLLGFSDKEVELAVNVR